jgi:hypothetical protein
MFVCLLTGSVPAVAQTHAESLLWGPAGRYGQFTGLSGNWAALAAIDSTLTAPADGNTVFVSGGGDALRLAIALAGSAGTLIEIMDSATYNWVTFDSKSRIYVRARAGQTPKILSNPTPPDSGSGGNSNAVVFTGSNENIGLQGLTFLVGFFGNAETTRQPTKVGAIRYSTLAGGTQLKGLLIQDCRFEALDRSLGAVVGVQLVSEAGEVALSNHRDIAIRRTVFDSTGTVAASEDDLAAITVTDFDNVLVANVHFRRSSTQPSASQMRGARLNVRRGLVEYAYCEDTGNAASANECVYISGDTTAASDDGDAVRGSGVLTGHAVTVRNSAALSSNRAFAVTLASSRLDVDHCVVATGAGGTILEAATSTSRLDVSSSIFLELSGTSRLLTREDGAVFDTDYNLYRWRGMLGFTQEMHDKLPGSNCDANCDPQFANPLSSDFRMVTGSPATRAGRDGTDMGVLFYSIAPASQNFGRTGGIGSVAVTASGSWSSVESHDWITLDSTSTVIGNATASYGVTPNTSSLARTGTIFVAGISHTVTQAGVPCSPSLSPSSQAVVAAGGAGSVAVAQAAAECTWTAVGNVSWVAVTGGGTGSGLSSSMAYSVEPNTSSNPRSGTVTVAGLTFTVHQAGLSCNYQLMPSSAEIPPAAMTGLTVQLSAAVADCAWSSSANAAWLHVTNGGSGLGGGTITYRADANANSAPRAGTLTISSQTFTVSQQGRTCTQQLSSTGAYIGAAGGAGSAVSVTSSAPDCTWTAASNAPTWLTLTSPNSVTGSAGVTWSAAENTSSQLRTGTLTASGQTFTVSQAGRTCAFSLSSSSTPAPLDAGGGTGGSVGITSTATDCQWTAASNAPWVTVTGGAAGTGNGVTAFTAAPNPSSVARTGTITVAGLIYTVTQAGRSCGFALAPTTATVGPAGGSGLVSLSALVSDCTWTASSNNVDWISVTSASPGVGSASVTYAVSANPRHAQRTGTLAVAGRTFSVSQPGVACVLSVSTASFSAGSASTSGVVSVVSNAPDCTWTVAPGASWLTLSGATSRTGSDTVSYSVAANGSSASRATAVTIAGQPIAVTQEGAPCGYTLASYTNSAAAAGANATVKLTVGAADCPWVTTSHASWITVTSGASRIGTGDVTMTIASNASSAKTRMGRVTVAGLTYTVTQAGVACTFTIPKVTTPSTAAAAGEPLSLPITTSPSDCEWTVASDAAWLVPGVSSGSGSGTITATAAATSSSATRAGNLTVTTGTTATKVPVTQSGVTCTYALSATGASFDHKAAAASVGIAPNAADCVWTANRGSTAWVTLDASAGTGTGLLSYRVLANTTTVPRQATLLVGGTGYVVTQGPAPCSVSVSSAGASVAAAAGAGTVGITAASAECTWTAASSVPWLTFTTATTLQGPGALKFAVEANTSSRNRTGTVTINDKTYTVTQAGAACAYTLTPASLALPPAGGPAAVTVTSSVGDCAWTATPSASWIQLQAAGGTGTGTLGLSVGPNSTTKSRTGSISIGGKSVSLTQTAQGASGELFTRYLSEGATSTFFNTRLALLNPGSKQSNVTLRFLKGTGETVEYATTLKPTSRLTIDPRTIVGSAEFSTEVESTTQVVVDRTMSWDASAYGSHAETGVQFPAETWYLAEGSTAGSFDLFYLIQNPNAEAANISVEFLLPGDAPVTKTYTVGPNSRFNIWVNQIPELAHVDLSGVVRSDTPIIVERAMYLSRANAVFVGGHGSAGVTAPATEWFLAEGATGPYFDTYVLIANPTPETAQVLVSYLLPGGGSVDKRYVIDPQSRFTIWVEQEDPLLADTGLSTVVRSTNNVPVIVERAMWWPGNWTTWAEAHNSPGTTATATKWAMAEGEVGGAFDSTTYVLVANTGGTAGQAKVTLMFESGTPVSKTIDLPASSRTNVDIGGTFSEALNKRFGILVESLGASPAPIVVERAIYTSSGGVGWAAGTNAVATPLP